MDRVGGGVGRGLGADKRGVAGGYAYIHQRGLDGDQRALLEAVGGGLGLGVVADRVGLLEVGAGVEVVVQFDVHADHGDRVSLAIQYGGADLGAVQ